MNDAKAIADKLASIGADDILGAKPKAAPPPPPAVRKRSSIAEFDLGSSYSYRPKHQLDGLRAGDRLSFGLEPPKFKPDRKPYPLGLDEWDALEAHRITRATTFEDWFIGCGIPVLVEGLDPDYMSAARLFIKLKREAFTKLRG